MAVTCLNGLMTTPTDISLGAKHLAAIDERLDGSGAALAATRNPMHGCYNRIPLSAYHVQDEWSEDGRRIMKEHPDIFVFDSEQ